MRGTEGELTRELRMVLDNAIQIRLNSTKGEPDAQAWASMAYPSLGLEPGGPFGLAEMLAGAPELLRQYRDDAATDPLLNALIQTCIDWTRCGFMRPMPQQDLLAVAEEILEENRPHLGDPADDLDAALCQAVQRDCGGRTGRPAPYLPTANASVVQIPPSSPAAWQVARIRGI